MTRKKSLDYIAFQISLFLLLFRTGYQTPRLSYSFSYSLSPPDIFAWPIHQPAGKKPPKSRTNRVSLAVIIRILVAHGVYDRSPERSGRDARALGAEPVSGLMPDPDRLHHAGVNGGAGRVTHLPVAQAGVYLLLVPMVSGPWRVVPMAAAAMPVVVIALAVVSRRVVRSAVQ